MIAREELDKARLEAQVAWDKYNKMFTEWYLNDVFQSNLFRKERINKS